MDFFEPRISADTASFWEGCRAHKLQFQRCKVCGKIRWPAAFLCPECLSEEAELVELPLRGTLYSYVVMKKPFHPSLKEKVPYIVATVDVEKDVRILTNLVDCDVSQLHCGDAVRIDWNDSDTYSRPIAKLEGGRQ